LKAMKLQTLPLTIEADKIAEGILGMFDDNERAVLRLGMLPAGKMEILEKMLREKFETLGTPALTSAPDCYFSNVNGECKSWSIKEMVTEATREITLALYRIGDLLV